MEHPDDAAHKAWLQEKADEERKATLPALPPPRLKANVKFVTEKSLLDTLHGLGEQVAKFVSPIEKRLEVLERTGLKDAGIWREGRRYKTGDVTTDKGMMFVCRSDNSSRPGEGPNWRMMHKSPRVAK